MIRKIINVLSWIAIVGMILLFGGVTVLRGFFGMNFMAVKTPSMEPDLPVGCLVVIKPVPFEDIHIGDDITFLLNSSGTTVTHRVIDIDKEGYITTQGLSNNTSDAPITYDRVLGKVVFSVDKIGKWFIFLSTASGKIIAVSMVAALLLISVIFEKFDKSKNSND